MLINPNENQININKLLYIHEEVGNEIISKGEVRDYFYQNYPILEFWTHYGSLNNGMKGFGKYKAIVTKNRGVTDYRGVIEMDDYGLDIEFKDTNAFVEIFSQDIKYDDSLAKLMDFDIIMFNNSPFILDIRNKTDLNWIEGDYIKIKNLLKTFPGKLFLIIIPPPLKKEDTTPENAKRARAFERFISSDKFLVGSKNIAIFNIFNLLATPDDDSENANTLGKKYEGTISSYLNENAINLVSKELIEFVQFISKSWGKYSLQIRTNV